MYLSFSVTGSFTLYYDGSWEDKLCAVFFDTVVTDWLTASARPGGSVQLDWNIVGVYDSAEIYRSSDGADYSMIADVSYGVTSYTDDGPLTVGQTYYYKARTKTGGAYSEFSSAAAAVIQAAPAESEVRAFLGSDTGTHGAWYGKYGGDGYILIGRAPSVTPPANNWNSETASSPALDLSSLPDYLDSYAYVGSHHLVFPPLSDGVNQDDVDMPPWESRSKYTVWDQGGGQTLTYQFNLNDDAQHVFTFYLSRRPAADVTARILDLDGNAVAGVSYTQADFDNSRYVSFMVKGSFRLAADNPGWFGVMAFFFDSPLPDTPSGLSAAPAAGRTVNLAWTNAGSPNKVVLERSADNINFSAIAAFTKGESAYTDTNLKPSATYFYRLRNIQGTRYGRATEAVSATIPAMVVTKLVLLGVSNAAASLGETVTVDVMLTRADDGSPLRSKEVFLKLVGSHVGDGTTVGQEIPEALGRASTDDGGLASVSFTAAYAGEFSLVAYTEPDDASGMDGAQTKPAPFTVSVPAEDSAPVVIKISDAVKPGACFSVNGSGLNDNSSLDIAVAPDAAGGSPAAPPAGALHPEIIQRDAAGLFAVARMPADAAPGVYNVWVTNENGVSACYKMNAARALFVSDDRLAAGLELEVVGRNFDGAEFGAASGPSVRLVSGTSVYPARVVKYNPFNISFAVGAEVPFGGYELQVSNDGLNWAALTSTKIRVEAAGADPLGMGVAWAKDFNWANRLNARDFGAIGDGAADDTAAVQAAVNAAASDPNGGVVYFPNGSYNIATVTLPSGVVLLGESKENTKLCYTGTGGVNFINSIDAAQGGYSGPAERQGVARLSMLLKNPGNRPDSFMWLGQGWKGAYENKAKRHANRLFVVDTIIDYPTDSAATTGGRGLGLEFIGNDRIFVADNVWTGYQAQPFITGMSEYYTLKNNSFTYTLGYVVSLSTNFFAENNVIKAVHQELGRESHGIFGRSCAYMAGNYVEGTGDIYNRYNDGEPLCVEVPAGYFNYGDILGATGTSLTVAPKKALTWPSMEYGELSVMIIGGKGTGQLRKVTSMAGFVITVDRAFDIVPDTTSIFTLIAPNDNATFYNNTVVNNAKGIWLFGNSYDGVVADNTSVNSEGVFIWSDRSGSGVVADYFSRVTRNSLTGVSKRTGYVSIGYNTGRSDGSHAYSTDVCGTEITDNQIIGSLAPRTANGDTEAPDLSGIYLASASYSSQYDNVLGSRDSINSIVEGNKLDQLNTGVTLTHSIYGQVITDNLYSADVL
ncbi:MAG: hypothetical protein FWC55_07515, partial [Firmicutes bacterium]|nr:hypothetical protein [Bacillota bacterium]